MPPDSRRNAQTEPAARLPTRVVQPDPVSTILVSAPAAARDAAGPSEITVQDPVRALVALGETDLTGPIPPELRNLASLTWLELAATSWSDSCGVGLALTRKARLSTAP